MKKWMIFFSLWFSLWLMASPAAITSLRSLKAGDKLPSTESLLRFQTEGNKLLLYCHSGRENNTKFFDELADSIGSKSGITLYIVDTNPQPGSELVSRFNSLTVPKKLVPDGDKKIYGELGIIVLPTLIFLNQNNILNSIITGYRSNLKMIFNLHMDALLRGIPPKDFTTSAENTRQDRAANTQNLTGFNLLVNQEFDLALLSFQKALEGDPENILAILGKGYAMFFQGRIQEGEAYFSSTTENKRRLFGYHLCRAKTSPTPDNLIFLSTLSLYETHYFMAVFEAAGILEKEGMCEESLSVYKHAYDILLKTYRKRK
ncbi:MAG: hypothetical protein MUP70_14355 [Candidatus Aminicenantes bacterium]|nr:hypothetical protein [Candidatus Aminicenantes bacterium]